MEGKKKEEKQEEEEERKEKKGKGNRKKKQLPVLQQHHSAPFACGGKALMGISRSGSNRPSGQLCSHLPT